MNLSWSELNKNIQTELKKKETFSQGINSLIFLRNEIFTVVENLFSDLFQNDFSLLPFPKSKGNDTSSTKFTNWVTSSLYCGLKILYKLLIFNRRLYAKKNFL